jgi:outer membrane protein assembly factor BamB
MQQSLLRNALGVVALLCFASSTLRADDWPQWLGPKRDAVWRETGILESFPKGGPTIRWRKEIGSGYSGPAVANGRVYVIDRVVAKGAKVPESGFDTMKSAIPGNERVLCFRESDGQLLWMKEYDCPYIVSYASGPRTTPTVDNGKVYTLGTMGDLYCFDALKGDILWNKNLPKEYSVKTPLWGFAGHPLVDGNRLICLVGGKGSTVVAFDKNSGKELWKNLTTEEPGYAAPMLYEVGGKKLLILWDAEAVNALNPETGELYWTQPFGSEPTRNKSGKRKLKAGMSIASPRLAGDLLLVSAFYNGSLVLKLGNAGGKPTATRVWEDKGTEIEPERTTGLHSVMVTPFVKDGYIYGACSYGEFRCLKADTGERLWMSLKPTTKDDEPLRWGTAFIVAQGDRFFLFNEHGDLIIAKLSPKGYQEVSRAHILEPTNGMARWNGPRLVLWSHPAFADRCMFARNDRELVCVSLAAEGK